MTKTFLAVASHWNVPGIRQYAAPDRAAAERKCVELVNELVEDWKGWAETRGAEAPPPVSGGDWESTLRALQLCRLIDYHGGEGEANDALYDYENDRKRGMVRPDQIPTIGEGFTVELQELIGDYVTDDDTDPDGIGFPMVWIEEVKAVETPFPSTHFVDVTGTLSGSMLEPTVEETEAWQYLVGNGDTKLGLLSWVAGQRGLDEIPCHAPEETVPAATGDTSDAETLVEIAERFLAESMANDIDCARVRRAISRFKKEPAPAAVGALDLGDVMSVIGYAESFTEHWADDEGQDDVDMEEAVKACATVERVKDQMLELFPLLARAIRDAGDAKGAIHSLLHQVDQMKGMFDDEDGTIEGAVECGEEVAHTLGCLRADLDALGTVPLKPVRIVVDVTGGCVQEVYADGDVDLYVADYDTDTVDEDSEGDLVDLPQSDGRTESGFFGGLDVKHDPVLIGAMLAAKRQHESALADEAKNISEAGGYGE